MLINNLDKIDKIKEKANYKIDLMKVNNEVLTAENEALNIKRDNILLKSKTGLFDKIKRSGMILSLLSLFSFLVSTTTAVICSYTVIEDFVIFIGIACILVVCEIITFISSKYTTITREKFSHRYAGLKVMQLGILCVTLTLNLKFIYIAFDSLVMTIIFLPVCFILDYSTMFFSGMGYDFKNLNFNVSNGKTGLLNKLIDNIFFKIRGWIENTYDKNHKVKIIVAESGDVKTNVAESGDVKIIVEEAEKDVKTDVKTDNVIMLKDNIKSLERIKADVKTDVKRTNVKSLKDVKRYLVKTYSNNDLVDVKTLKDKFDLTAREWQTVKKEIAELVTKGTNTYFIRAEEEALK